MRRDTVVGTLLDRPSSIPFETPGQQILLAISEHPDRTSICRMRDFLLHAARQNKRRPAYVQVAMAEEMARSFVCMPEETAWEIYVVAIAAPAYRRALEELQAGGEPNALDEIVYAITQSPTDVWIVHASDLVPTNAGAVTDQPQWAVRIPLPDKYIRAMTGDPGRAAWQLYLAAVAGDVFRSYEAGVAMAPSGIVAL